MTIQKEQFIKALAQFLAKDLAAKSIALEAERALEPSDQGYQRPRFAEHWAELYKLAGLSSWATTVEAEARLNGLLEP